MQKETRKATKPMEKAEKADNYTFVETEAMTENRREGKDIKREQLEEVFCHKINGELEGFKEGALRLEKEEIFSIAYRIDCMIRIYETLAERSGELGEEELKRCVQEEGILQSLYQRWLKSPAPQEEELEHSVRSGIREICRAAAGEPLITEEKAGNGKQKYQEPREKTGERKALEIHEGRKTRKSNGIQKAQTTEENNETLGALKARARNEAQGTQRKQAPGKSRAAQRKGRFYGKIDSDQKPAA